MKADLPIHILKRYFDKDFYLKKYPDIKEAKVNPLRHYFNYGLWENRWPNPNFDPAWYENQCPEIKETNLSPLAYYIKEGEKKGDITKLPDFFSHRTYLSKNLALALNFNQNDLISIVMAVKNPIKDWTASLQSILGQSYANFEVILILDRDKSYLQKKSKLIIPKNIKDKRIKVHQTISPGRANSLNYALSLAKGKFICYLDSDNWLDPHFLTIMRYELVKNKTDFIYSGLLKSDDRECFYHFIKYSPAGIRRYSVIDTNTMMHTKNILQKVGGFDANLTRLIDYDFILNASEMGATFSALPIFLTYYDHSSNPERISNKENIHINLKKIRKKNIDFLMLRDEQFYLKYEHIRPQKIRLEISSACQLRCPSCPTTTKEALPAIGQGFLELYHFKELINESPWVKEIEISNYGEIFLNPELPKILEAAYINGIKITINNGTNLNHVSHESLEALVKYKVGSLVCSIDGASQETYEKYRVRGNLMRVIEHIKKINFYKEKYHSQTPKLIWQFILFEHNKDEIVKAKEMAQALSMDFQVKTSWDDKLAPTTLNHSINSHINLRFISRNAYKKELKQDPYIGICKQLWEEPQINWDGKVLGCCRNFWGDFGEGTFQNGLLKAINGEKISYARLMLKGFLPERVGIPCTSCEIYKERK
jgi:glycosyltransferase involved in cell wall biosynthesis